MRSPSRGLVLLAALLVGCASAPAPGCGPGGRPPRCTPVAATATPTPTPLPTRTPAAPTWDARPWLGGSATQTVFHLPGALADLDLAVHPTAGWPVVGVVQRAWGTPLHAFVRVYSPATHTWGPARQVDTGPTSLGADRFGSLAVGVAADGTVYAAWGASDRDAAGATPDLWVRTSQDGGASWDAPTRLARHCWTVLDLATGTDGTVVVLANCYARSGAQLRSQATLLVKPPGGPWRPPQVVAARARFGAVVIVGAGPDARAVALTAPYQPPHQRQLHLLTQRLADGGAWEVHALQVPIAADPTVPDPARAAPWHLRGLTFARPLPEGGTATGVLFTWATVTRAALFALASPDGGRTWAPIATVQQRAGDPAAIGAQDWVAPAYDPATDRLLAFWPCCAVSDDPASPAPHHAAWRAGEGGAWQVLPGPLVTGARASGALATAQALGRRTLWLAWVEGGQRVQVRSAALDTLVPAARSGGMP